jgi:hypothetical protein
VAEAEAEASAQRKALEDRYGPGDVFDTTELQHHFTVHNFLAPLVRVTRKSDGVMGTLEFQHSPRLYFNFIPG